MQYLKSGAFVGRMKKLIFFFVLISFFSSRCQEIRHRDEFGGGLGVMHYTGDLSPTLQVNDFSPAFQAFYRNNYPNNYSVLRVNLLVGNITANENNQSDPLPISRGLSFSSTVVEFAGIYEYNFLNYREISRGTHENNYLSPYVYGGLGAAIMIGGAAPAYIVIPIGVGVKFQLSTNLNLGFEIGIRKTFTDDLDGYSDDEALNSSSRLDSYYNSGLTLSYTIYSDMCAPHYKEW